MEFTIDGISLMKPDAPWTSYYFYRSRSPLTIKDNWATYEILFKASKTDSDARITLFLVVNDLLMLTWNSKNSQL